MKYTRRVAKLLCLPLLCLALSGADSHASGKLPGKAEIDDALVKQFHGRTKLTGCQVEILYDFKDLEQGKDFHTPAIERNARGEVVKSSYDPVTCKPGQLVLSYDDMIYWIHPVTQLDLLQFTVSGVDSMLIFVWGKSGNTRVNIGAKSSISISKEANVVGSDGADARAVRLDPKRSYRVEFAMAKGNAVLKVDGKKIVEKAIPDGYVSEGSIGISGSGDARASVSSLSLRGWIRRSELLIAANRGRAKEKLPPLWDSIFTATGEHYEVVCADSQASADLWSRWLDAQIHAIDKDYPSIPAQSKKRLIYVFDQADMLASYKEGIDACQLPDGSYAVACETGKSLEAQRARQSALRASACEEIHRRYPTAPPWWLYGQMEYYSWGSDFDKAAPRLGVLDADLVKLAKQYLNKPFAEPLRTLFQTWPSGDAESNPAFVCAAWLHFLRSGEGGANAGILCCFHDAFRAGKEAAAALDETMPASLFDELYPKFLKYLDTVE